MTDDDHPLGGIDLAAWEPPPPPPDLADAVMARMREPVGAAALDHGDGGVVDRGPRRRWLAGAAVMVAAVVAAIAIVVGAGDRDETKRLRAELAQAQRQVAALDDKLAALDHKLAALDAARPADVAVPRPGGPIPVPPPTADALPKGCDSEALRARGDDQYWQGNQAAALVAFEAALACKPDDKLVQRVFMASCASMNAAKARKYYAQLAKDRQAALSQVCLRLGIDPVSTPPHRAPPACDRAGLVNQGDEAVQNGAHAAALRSYEGALRCRVDELVVSKAYLAACNGKNAAKARDYYRRLPAGKRNLLSQACLRFGIDPLGDDQP
ncbi:MAG: hypothetical protein H6Q90_2190 [Deltaproteobacteria bacterium]|nr:hypothetical protein [Deltaproteobacteria bacterium]